MAKAKAIKLTAKQELYGQWFRSALLHQFFKEKDCWKLIDGEMAYSFRVMAGKNA